MVTSIYRVEQNEKFGRHLVASKLIKQGEIIIQEKPLIVTPHIGGPLICFKCCDRLQKKVSVCENCKIALLCDQKCKGVYHDDECELWKLLKITTANLLENPEIVTPLRCLLNLRKNNENWSSFLNLESHINSRKNTEIWRRCKVEIENILRDFGIIDDQNDGIIQKICGIIDVNSFEIRPRNELVSSPIERLRGVYLKAALLTHDCIGNTHLAVDENFELFVRASVDISEGQPIFFNYTNNLKGYKERQEHLKEGKYFECSCVRCKDPSELATGMNSLICPRCKNYIQQNVSRNFWNCIKYGYKYHNSMIGVTIEIARRKMEELEGPSIDEMEKLLKIFSRTFHPNHYIVLEIEQDLVRWYSRTLPNNKNLNRKIELCKKLLDIFEKVEPGISRIRAITLYELHSAMVNLIQKNHNNKEITDEEFLEKLLEAEGILKEAVKFLLYEPKNSPEGRLALTALSELRMLKSAIQNVQKMNLTQVDETKKKVRKNKRNKISHK